MIDLLVAQYFWTRAVLCRAVGDERGEGVISAAIVVLIMAAIGALMWTGLRQLWTTTSTKTSSQVNTIGS